MDSGRDKELVPVTQSSKHGLLSFVILRRSSYLSYWAFVETQSPLDSGQALAIDYRQCRR